MVMICKLFNVPSTFMEFMHKVSREFMGILVFYFDDILIYSPFIKSHLEHIWAVYDTLKCEQLLIKY
jgi:hypothetical protein